MKYFFIVICSLLIFSCERKTSLNLKMLNLEYLNNFEESVIDTNLSYIFSNHFAYFLENTDSLLIKDITNLSFYDNYLIILNNHKILLYDMLTIRQIKILDSDKYIFESFDLDTLNKKLYTLDSKKKRIVRFSINGEEEEEIALNPKLEYNDLIYLGSNNLLMTAKSIPFPVTFVINTKTKHVLYIDNPKKKSFTPAHELYDSLVKNCAPLYIYNKNPEGLLIKYIFNDTIYNYSSSGKSIAFFVKTGNERVSFRNKKKLIRDNNQLCLLGFWKLNNSWLIRFKDKNFSSIVICDSLMRPFYPGSTMWSEPTTIFYIQGCNKLFMDERGQILFSIQNYREKKGDLFKNFMKDLKLPSYLKDYKHKGDFLLCSYSIKK